MERQGSVETITVLTTVVVAPQNWFRLPSRVVQVCVIGGKAASLGVGLLGLQELLGGTVSGVEFALRSLESLAGGGVPTSLSKISVTFQPGWAC